MQDKMNTKLIGIIKQKIHVLITTCKFSDDPKEDMEIKKMVTEELNTNWHDERFRIGELEKEMEHRYYEYRLSTYKALAIEKVKFWESVCIEAAKHSAEPHLIADSALLAKERVLAVEQQTYLGEDLV